MTSSPNLDLYKHYAPNYLTYAGIPQDQIVASLKRLVAFVKRIDITGVELLKHDAELMLAPGGYVDRIAKAATGVELAQAVQNYSAEENMQLGYAARGFEHALQTYASIRHLDKDALCQEAYGVLADLRAWGGMPPSPYTVISQAEGAARKVFEAKKPALEACDGMFLGLPATAPQLGYKYYIHPIPGVCTRDDLAAKIGAILDDWQTRDPSLYSEMPHRYHTREGNVSQVEGSPLAVYKLREELKSLGFADDRCVEFVSGPQNPPNAGFTRSWGGYYRDQFPNL